MDLSNYNISYNKDDWRYYLDHRYNIDYKKAFKNASLIKTSILEYKDKLIYDSTITYEHLSSCKVFQFFGKDSVNGKITRSFNLDNNGNKIEEVYKGYKNTTHSGRGDCKIFYEYDSKNNLIARTYYPVSGETIKTFYSYSEDSQLQKSVQFTSRYLTVHDVINKYFIAKEGITRVWKLCNISIFDYDKKGRLKSQISLDDDFSDIYKKKYKFKNDSSVLISVYAGWKSTNRYTYNLSKENDYRYTSRDYFGQISNEWSILYDEIVPEQKNDRVNKTFSNKGELIETVEIKYDKEKRLSKTIVTNKNGITTHIYNYAD